MMLIIVLLLIFNDIDATDDSVAANDDVDDVVDGVNDDNNGDIINDASFSFDHNTIIIFRWKLKETIKLMET